MHKVVLHLLIISKIYLKKLMVKNISFTDFFLFSPIRMPVFFAGAVKCVGFALTLGLEYKLYFFWVYYDE